MKRLFDILIISASNFLTLTGFVLFFSFLLLIFTACSSSSGGGGSGGSAPTASVTQTPKDLYSEWATGSLAAPAIYLGFNTQTLDPQNLAVVFLDLTDAKLNQFSMSVGPGINSLFCHFTGTLDEATKTINLISAVADSQQTTKTADAILIEQNLQTYCFSLVDLWTYSLNNNQLEVCSQSQGCYTFQ